MTPTGDFYEVLCWGVNKIYIDKIKVQLKLDKNNTHFI